MTGVQTCALPILAFELTSLVHGEEEAAKAKEASRSLFAGAGASANAPTHLLLDDDFTEEMIDIITLLCTSGLVPSKSEARRAVEQGGVSVNGEKITDIKKTFGKTDFSSEFLLKRGKKSFMKIEYK